MKIITGKSGSAKTLTSHAGNDTLMRCVTSKFSYVSESPALLG